MVSHFTYPRLEAGQPSYPDWSSAIRSHYWHLRAARAFDSARVRKEYRRIEAEKKRLEIAGIPAEGIRLLCRHLVNFGNQNAARRWWDWLKSHLEFREFGSYVIPELTATDCSQKPTPKPAANPYRLRLPALPAATKKLFRVSLELGGRHA